MYKAALLIVCLAIQTQVSVANTSHIVGTNLAISDRISVLSLGGNNVIVGGFSEGLVIVDGGSEYQNPFILNSIDAYDKKILALINTHWHSQQTGLNSELGQRGVPIVSHKNAYHWLANSHYQVWENRKIPALPSIALPSQTFFDNKIIETNNTRIELHYLRQAHTDTDIAVHFIDDNIIAIGGTINGDSWPVIDWWSAGWFGGLLDSLEFLLTLGDEETIYIPSHGPVISKQQLQQEYEMYTVLFDDILSLLKQSLSPAEAVATKPTKNYHPEWKNQDAFVEAAFRSFYGHLRGEKRMGLMP